MQPPEKVYLIDTNVILRYLLDDHKRFSPKAKAFLQDVAKEIKRAELPSVVIVECVYVMEKYYEIPKSAFIKWLALHGEVGIGALSAVLNFSTE